MTESQILLAAAALLIAAMMLPLPSGVRGVFFVLLGGFYLLMGFGLSLRPACASRDKRTDHYKLRISSR